MIFSVELFGLSAVLLAALAVVIFTLVAASLVLSQPLVRLRDLALRRRTFLLLILYAIFMLSVSAFTRIPPYVQDTMALNFALHPHPQADTPRQQHQQQHQQMSPLLKPTPSLAFATNRLSNLDATVPLEVSVASTYAPFSLELFSLFPNAAFVTFATDAYADAVENLIGSLHVWAHGLPIHVYSMGLSPKNRQRIANLRFTNLIDFNVSAYPSHLRFIHNYAFKPVLLTEALNKAEMILALDAGVEVRGSLLHVMQAINTRGYFYVEASASDPLTRVHPGTVRWLGLPPPSPNERMCYGGMQGYKRGSLAARLVLSEAARCALAPSCMDPLGSGHENHRYEQSVISLLLRRHQLHCALGAGFNEHRPVTLHPNPLTPNQPQTFFLRRWRFPKPYIPYAARISDQLAELSPPGDEHESGAPSAPGSTAHTSSPLMLADNDPAFALQSEQDDDIKTDPTAGFFESSVTDRKNSDNKVLQCLQSTEYNLTACRDLLAGLRASERSRVRLGSDAFRELLRVNTWVVQRGGELFWYWPISFTAAALFNATLLLTFVSLCNTHRLNRLCSIIAFFVLAGLWLHHVFTLFISPPTTCTPGFPIHFHVNARREGSTPVNPLLPRFSGEAECIGQSGHVLSFEALPYVIWVNTRQYAFYSTTLYGHTVIGYAVSIHTRTPSPASGSLTISSLAEAPAQPAEAGRIVILGNTAARHPMFVRTLRARLRLLSVLSRAGEEGKAREEEEEGQVSSWQHIGQALVEPFAFDRPCVFQHNETFYMLPSLKKSSRVMLYTTKSFPTGWVPLKDILLARWHVDSMLYYQNDVWYLGVLEQPGKRFQVHRSSSPEGPFSQMAPSTAPLLEPRSAVCRHLLPSDL
jgi:hypothetical protein